MPFLGVCFFYAKRKKIQKNIVYFAEMVYNIISYINIANITGDTK